MYKSISVLALSLTVLSGCSSIVSKSDYPVSISSSPQMASFVVTNKAGERVQSGVTPSVVTLGASSGFFRGESYTISLTKNGFDDKTYTLKSTVDGWYFGNVLVGGLIGMLIIDPATGAMYSLPDRVDINLDSSSRSKSKLDVTSIENLTEDQKANILPLI